MMWPNLIFMFSKKKNSENSSRSVKNMQYIFNFCLCINAKTQNINHLCLLLYLHS